jgi:D-alanyl-D-alanine carboxypeptidase
MPRRASSGFCPTSPAGDASLHLQEAERWVATPSTSAHVNGKAVDIGDSNAAAWLSEHGAQYGLCRIYGNEPWHFELRREAIDHGCPAIYPDPTHDSRMQR